MDTPIVNGSPEAARTDLVVMLKAPSNAKRRLAAEVGDLAEEAAACLLACVLEDVLSWPGPTWLSPANQRDLEWLVTMVNTESVQIRKSRPAIDRTASQTDSVETCRGEICGVVPQRDGDLGERINSVDSDLRRRGVSRLIFLGTDCPCLDASYLEQAARSLQKADAVLGPAEDGGVVLMGANRPWPDLKELGWSTQGLCSELRGLCREAGWSVDMLDTREDVDTLGDLLGTAAAISGDNRPARRDFAEWLSAHRVALLARQFNRLADARRETTL